MMTEFEKLLDRALKGAARTDQGRDDGWSRYGLRGNPFPSRAHPIWDVLHNQKPVLDRFFGDLVGFIRERKTTTLFFTGGNRVGKTYFMERHRRILPSKLNERGIVLPIAIISAQSCDIEELYRRMVEQIDDSLHLQTGSGLFQQAEPPWVVERLPMLPPGDFRRAVEAHANAKNESERIEVGQLLQQWIRGARIRVTQLKPIGIHEPLTSSAPILNVFEALVRYLLVWGDPSSDDHPRCPGILVFLDEFELIFKHRRDRRDQFLRALRAMIDAYPSGLFLCAGMATGLGVAPYEVESSYPAFHARMVGARPVPALIQVTGVVEAIEYAKAFLDHGKKVFAKELKPKQELFSDQEIQQIFKDKVGISGAMAQGDFFDALHETAEQKVRRLLQQRS